MKFIIFMNIEIFTTDLQKPPKNTMLQGISNEIQMPELRILCEKKFLNEHVCRE